MPATIKIPSIFTAKDKFSSVVNKMIGVTKRFSNQGISAIKRFDHRISKTFNKLGRLTRMGLGIGAGFIALNALNVVKDYEQSVADLNAVMNTTSVNQMLLMNDSKRLGSITAKTSTEVVGLQEAYARLGFGTQEILDMTESTINGSIAMNAELADTAELTGAMVRTFDKFSSIDAPDILDKMTLSTQKSALNFEKLQTALPIVSGAANAAGVPFDRLLALLGKLSDAGIDASSSSTALRNIFLDSAKKGHSYEQILANIQKNQDKLTAANDEFGKRGAVSATILANKLGEVSELTQTLENDFKGVADTAAKKRLDTFGGSLTLLQSAYEGLLLRTSDESGAMAILTTVVQFVTKNIETLALIIASVIGLFILMKVVVVAATIVNTAYSIAMGISAARTGAMSIAMKENIVAQTAYKIAMGVSTAWTWLATAATTAFGIALNLGLWPILAIIAAIVAVVLVIKNWSAITDWFGEKWKQFTSWISELWGKVVEWFKNFDFIQFFKGIGQSILTFLLTPMKMMLTLLSNIPGKIGKIASLGLDKINDVTGQIDVKKEVLPSTAQASNESVQKTIQQSSLDINIKDKGGNVESTRQKRGRKEIPVSVTNTVGAF